MSHGHDSTGPEGVTEKERQTIRWWTGLGILAVLGFLMWYFGHSAPPLYSLDV